MIKEPQSINYSITTNLLRGSFRFKANNNDEIWFGQSTTQEIGVPEFTCGNVSIIQSGNYTIKLLLQEAGNYAYSVKRNF